MSLDAWEWEGEDRGSVGPRASMGTSHQSGSECEVEECLKAGAGAQESESDHQCSSIGSSGPASTFNSDPPHVVPCEFTISLAFPVNVGHKGKYTSLTEKYRKHSEMDRPSTKMCRYYHIEYFLLPDDREPEIVDMVVFPAVAKVFLDSGVKTVRPWREGDKAWVSWTQTLNVNMTKELLKKINFHKITLKLWDTQDKVSRKVRCFRLKKTGYSDDAVSYEEVRRLVLSQRSLSEQGIHVKEECNLEDAPVRPEEARRHLKSLCGFHTGNPETFSKDTKEYEKQQKAEDLGSVRWSISGRPTLSLDKTSMIEMKELLENSSLTSLTNVLKKQKFQIKWKESEGKRKSQKRVKMSGAEEEADPKLAGPLKQGAFCIQLAVMPLLAGRRTVVSRASEKSANISDCFLTFKTEVPIMTEEQKRDLNPLTIKIKCVSCLPSQPVPVHELERLCTPVYCKYQFHKTPVHETEGKPHAAHISFQDINVVFLGAMQPSDLREYLGGPPMVVEVHDRDRKSEQYSQEPTLFGDDPLDSHLNLHALISPKETENNPFASQNKLWDPYGVAQVSFADLLLGCKYLNLAVPVHSCEAPPTHRSQDGRARKVMGLHVPTDGLQHHPMPKGDYLEADSLLKLRVDIAVSLQAGTEIPNPDPTGAQFGRIIFVFDCRRAFLLYSLLQDITAINARALDLGSCPVKDSQQVLSAFKMRVKVQERQDLDVLTGFHLLDGKIHVLILEGLANRGLKRLWDSHQSRKISREPTRSARSLQSPR
ncbi:uncharacterized protein CFAP92 [Manis javanica]|uniref:uncharacterized protein CFAP92 n=1 Tax=Manis javanica TaxID=9974 RepID=UPI003C6CCD67